MTTRVHRQVEGARNGTEPALICRVPSGWAILAGMQYLPGYTILLPDPVVASLNDLPVERRAAYLGDMVMIGDALLEVTGACRINYAIMGNEDPALHAHIVPRYLSEPEAILHGSPWAYPQETMQATLFDPERDQDLMRNLAADIRKRM